MAQIIPHIGGTLKKKLTVFMTILALSFCPVYVSAQANGLLWSLALQNVRTGDLVPFSIPVQSWTGEQFRLVIQPNAACYAYVIYESPSGDEVAVLFAGALKGNEAWYSQILELAPPRGSESFYVIASLEEQKVLAQRIASFNANSSSLQRRSLMNEVFRIRGEASQFREAPEKPVLMGGASRGTPDKNQGVEYSGAGAYVKIINIEH